MTNIGKFRALFNQYDFVFKGIHLNRVICVELWEFANHNMMFGIHTLLKYFFTYWDVCKMETQCEILSTGGVGNRKDYLELYQQTIDKLGDKTIYNAPYSWGRKICFHPKMMASVFFKSIKLLRDAELNLIEKICIINVAIYYCNIILALEKCDFSRVKKYVCLVDALRLENLLTQYMQTKGIKTYSHEEGIFYIFKGKIPHDAVHYEVLTTEHLLCWSQYVIDEYSNYGICKDRLALAGYPRKVLVKRMKEPNIFRKCLLLLARSVFDNANQKLLEMLSTLTFDHHFCLKLHPSCNYEKYAQLAQRYRMEIVSKDLTINDCLNQDEYDWAIAVNTTAYYEALMRGVPCLRFEDNSYQLPFGWSDTFYSREGLESVLASIRKMDSNEFQKDIDDMLRYTMGVGIDNYKEILLS